MIWCVIICVISLLLNFACFFACKGLFSKFDELNKKFCTFNFNDLLGDIMPPIEGVNRGLYGEDQNEEI